MIWLYRLVFVPALLVLLPGILARMLRRGGLRENFGQRFGAGTPLGDPPPGGKRIWIHAVSVGEILAIAPLVERLLSSSRTQIFLTTTTTTGFAVGRDRYRMPGVEIGYFPLDFWPFSARAWRRIQPDLMVLTESELWPEHLFQARKRGVSVLLINARLSDRSLSRLRKIGGLVRPLVRGIKRISAASGIDAARFAEIRFPGATVETTGNLKLDAAIGPVLDEEEKTRLRAELGLPDGLILMGSSTWPGEETALVRAMTAARAAGLFCRLLIVPRHAERRDEILGELKRHPHRFHLRTTGSADSAVDICVADTTGEMVRLLQLAEVVFVGRSLAPHYGGQTPVEAAA
ncbi:MAG: 3-deoxy-D-manno-octulosonic acid transferase, partial [Opitutaceae bacterium]